MATAKKAAKKAATAPTQPSAPAAAVAPTPAPAAAAPAQPAREQRNGVSRPGAGTSTGRVWEIADQLSQQLGQPVPRGDVMKAGLAEGLNQATIATQYGRWRKFYGLGKATPATAAATEDDAEVETEEE